MLQEIKPPCVPLQNIDVSTSAQTSQNVVKTKTEIIEIDEQTKVKQELGQTSQEASLKRARPECKQNHNMPAINKTSQKEQPFDMNEEAMEYREGAPNVDFDPLTKPLRRNHKRLHKCDQCPFASMKREHLMVHIRSHTGDKPFKCAYCNFAATTGGNLKIHMRVHSGEKPYKCEQCSYASADKSTLKKHMLTHSGEKPFKCNQCSHASSIKANLQAHMRIHTGEKPYKCNQCTYAAADYSSLRCHMCRHNTNKTKPGRNGVVSVIDMEL